MLNLLQGIFAVALGNGITILFGTLLKQSEQVTPENVTIGFFILLVGFGMGYLLTRKRRGFIFPILFGVFLGLGFIS